MDNEAYICPSNARTTTAKNDTPTPVAHKTTIHADAKPLPPRSFRPPPKCRRPYHVARMATPVRIHRSRRQIPRRVHAPMPTIRKILQIERPRPPARCAQPIKARPVTLTPIRKRAALFKLAQCHVIRIRYQIPGERLRNPAPPCRLAHSAKMHPHQIQRRRVTLPARRKNGAHVPSRRRRAHVDCLHGHSPVRTNEDGPNRPILPTPPDFFCQPNTNYAHSTQQKKSNIAHFPTSKERETKQLT